MASFSMECCRPIILKSGFGRTISRDGYAFNAVSGLLLETGDSWPRAATVHFRLKVLREILRPRPGLRMTVLLMVIPEVEPIKRKTLSNQLLLLSFCLYFPNWNQPVHISQLRKQPGP